MHSHKHLLVVTGRHSEFLKLCTEIGACCKLFSRKGVQQQSVIT